MDACVEERLCRELSSRKKQNEQKHVDMKTMYTFLATTWNEA